MNSPTRPTAMYSLLSVNIEHEQDIVSARQRARHLAEWLGFSAQDQSRLATAVSEIARNAYRYAEGGRVDFSLDLQATPQFFWVEVVDQGRGIEDLDRILDGRYESPTGMGLGLSGSRRLMDAFRIESAPGQGTRVRFGKAIPGGPKALELPDAGKVSFRIAQAQLPGALEEFQRQNRDLLQTLEIVRLREAELAKRQAELTRLNLELEETNRGVVALYAELDEKAEALRRADHMKSRFLSYMSHEFRTPLNSVLALTHLLIQRTDGDLSPEQERQVGYIRQAAQELGEMVNDLLDLAKVESGKTNLRITRIDPGQLLGAVRGLMRPLAANDAVALVFDEPAAGLTIETDETKLGQIFRNLISNALKFTQKGEVRVSAAASASRDEIVFTVADTGIGIAPEHQQRIFHEFSQLENPIQKHVKGTGLGLPLSRKLAELLGGRLEVSSRPGTGSTFTLTLPLSASQQPGSILIIDDEHTSRYVSQRLLRGTRRRIIEAARAEEGIERARFEHPDLILLDLMIPDRSGFDIITELKADPSTSDIPVIIHTSRVLSQADYDRLGGRQAAILPKGEGDRLHALNTMRSILGEPALFANEPEFLGRGKGDLIA
ncbi:MAG TPA: ATP-binding protein [Bryobacteraceae bacterium]|nr:ATP-binding protein [Bryobacteraceae bacterium]